MLVVWFKIYFLAMELIIKYKDGTIFRTINLNFTSNLISCYRMAIKQKNKIGGKIEKRPYK